MYHSENDGVTSGVFGLYGPYVFGNIGFTPKGFEDEQWAPLFDRDDYWVSTLGRVWSHHSNTFLTPKRLDRKGHLGVCLAPEKSGESKKYVYLHRAMAEAFIPNPKNYPVVRHLDDDVDNNELWNLAWGTQLDNHYDCVENDHYRPFTDEDREIGCQKSRKPVWVTRLSDGKELWFRSMNDACRALGVQQANACKTVVGSRKHTCGYRFRYEV